MPWKSTSNLRARWDFIEYLARPNITMTAACRKFGISRKVGYKWKRRFDDAGLVNLVDKSHARIKRLLTLTSNINDRIIKIRRKYETWGASKIRAELIRAGDSPIPSRSTIHRVLLQNNLVEKRRKTPVDKEQVRIGDYTYKPTMPNDEWSVDYKGWWYGRDGVTKINVLTICDTFSRVVLNASISDASEESAKRAFIKLFKKYGMPLHIRSDNGTPFASTTSLLGLSSLSVWWIRLGIKPIRARKGCPQDNGIHERMHRVMEEELARYNADTPGEFEAWVRYYNMKRPHGALNDRYPVELYEKSPRKYPRKLKDYDYRPMEVRRISTKGKLCWRRIDYYLTQALWGQRVGLEKKEENIYVVWFENYKLGILDCKARIFIPERRNGKNKKRPSKGTPRIQKRRVPKWGVTHQTRK